MRSGRLRLLGGWLVGSALLAFAALTVCLMGQQIGRRTIEDAPRAMLTQARELLGSGASPAAVTGSRVVDLGTDGAPFVIVYDDAHAILASSASLHGRAPDLPSGVLDEAARRDEVQVTWQPAPDVREAVVASRWHSASGAGVVVSGVGLASSEARTAALLGWVGAGWALAQVVLSAVVLWLATRRQAPQI